MTTNTAHPNSRPTKAKVPAKYLLSLLALLFVVSLLTLLDHYQLVSVDPTLLIASRCTFLLGLIGYAVQKRSLTTWILVSMVLGAEFGHDLPDIAVNLNVVSQIFLRLIKTIIAPLLFATIVVGIAGHSDLKQVGSHGLEIAPLFRDCIHNRPCNRPDIDQHQQSGHWSERTPKTWRTLNSQTFSH